MHKTTTLLAFFAFLTSLSAQMPFTITPDNFPVYEVQYQNVRTNAPSSANITPSANGYWDLSSIHGTEVAENNYVEETDPFYTSQGVDVYILEFKKLTSELGYGVYYEFDFNDEGIFDEAIYVSDQRYGLGSFTGNNADSLVIPFQAKFFSAPRQVMKFPATYGTGWRSNSRRVVDLKLSVAAAGMNKTPGLHVFNVTRTDTIIGWGKMRVYTGTAASIPYDVLINKSRQITKDSFYIAGAPAGPAILSVFGISQGQISSNVSRYLAYREGYSTPLAIINYASDTYQVPTVVFTDAQNLATSSTDSPETELFSTLVFPNPVRSGVIHVVINGKSPEVSLFQLADIQGRIVQSGSAVLNNGILEVQVKQGMPSGAYWLQLSGADLRPVITEQVMIGE